MGCELNLAPEGVWWVYDGVACLFGVSLYGIGGGGFRDTSRLAARFQGMQIYY